MEISHGFPPLTSLAAVLLCGALMVALYQALFPRPARWGVVIVALILGGSLTVTLTLLLSPTKDRLAEITDLWSALRVVVLTVGLPEEGIKFAAAAIAIALFRRPATPAEAFQAALFAALGFAVVENSLYAKAFSEASLAIAFGRGIVASFIHSLMGMIQGFFLARFVATGWRRWHLPVIGYLCAAAAHSGFDWGMLKPLAEYLQTKDVQPATMMAAIPVLLIGLPAPFLAGLWCLRRALRDAGAADPRGAEPWYRARIAIWRRIGNGLLAIGGVCLAGIVAVLVYLAVTGALPKEAATGQPTDMSSLTGNILAAGVIVMSPMAMVFGWLLRQKR